MFFSFAFCTFFKIVHVCLGEKVKVLVFRGWMYCVKAKLTLVSFFLLFLCTFPYLCSLPNFLLEYANIFTHIYFTQVFFYTDIFLTWIRQYFYTDIPATSATFHMCLSLLMLLLMMILISMYFCFALLHVSDVWVRQMERHLVHSLFTALLQKYVLICPFFRY